MDNVIKPKSTTPTNPITETSDGHRSEEGTTLKQETQLPNLLKTLITRIQGAAYSREAFEILESSLGGSNGLQYENNCYSIGEYTFILINNPQRSSAIQCLKANQDGHILSVPQLVESIVLNNAATMILIKKPTKDSLISFDEAALSGFISDNHKQTFLKDVDKLLEKGVLPDVIIEENGKNLFFDKANKRILFLDLHEAIFDENLEKEEVNAFKTKLVQILS